MCSNTQLKHEAGMESRKLKFMQLLKNALASTSRCNQFAKDFVQCHALSRHFIVETTIQGLPSIPREVYRIFRPRGVKAKEGVC